MKDIDRFWTTSGRVDSFAFEIVSPNNFEQHLGWLSGVKGGSLTFGYNTDLKVSGSIDVSTTSFVENCIIRVHYKPKLSESQKKDIVLGTFFAYTGNMKFDKGRYTGTIELISTLARYTDDMLQQNFTIGKNKTYKSEFKRLIQSESTGGAYKYETDVADKKCTSAILTEKGKPTMEVVQLIANGLGARVTVNKWGTLVFEKYYAPSKKTCTLKLPTGQYSVTMPAVEISDPKPDMPNRIAYHCKVSYKAEVYVLDKNGNKIKYTSGENKGKYQTKTEDKIVSVVGKAQVSKDSPIHYSKRGRWVTQIYEYEKTLSASSVNTSAKLEAELAKVKKEANNKAATKLSTLTSGTRKYIIECYYLPIECGQVVQFEHIASGLKLHVQAMVENIELDLSVGGKMKVTLQHIRKV